MNRFISLLDVSDKESLLKKALSIKQDPWQFEKTGHHKSIGLLFFNPSLRTRMSTQQAAQRLGMHVISMNADQGWKIEFEDGAIMDSDKAE
ncbi:MAG: acetylornithine carbamoyltransferase, partial [Saprospiraceae bacterium]